MSDQLPFDTPEQAPDFDGETYDREQDHQRLGAQALRVFKTIRAGGWWTLREIAVITGDGEAGISARLRDFRKPKCGSHTVERRRRGAGRNGLHEYRLVTNPQARLDLLGVTEESHG